MTTSTEPRVLRVEDGGDVNRVVLPTGLREKLGLKCNDGVFAIETPEGLLLMSRDAMIDYDYRVTDAEMRKHGVTLDEMIESGREIRAELMKERYGIE